MNASKRQDLESRYARRRRSILSQIPGEAALFTAATAKTRSRDTEHPFRQDSDFLYLTGVNESNAALLLLGSGKGPRSILFVTERDPKKEQWVGERLGVRRAKRRMKIDEVRPFSELFDSLPSLLNECTTLHYGAGSNPDIDELVWEIFRTQKGPNFSLPHLLVDARLITSEMRIVKDRDEIRTMKHAAEISARAFKEFLRGISKVKSEKHGAAVLDSLFARFGAEGNAFDTIVASGKNATTLHHIPGFQPLFKRDLVLIDAGASFRGYASDITRTVPANGRFSEEHARVYDVVLNAQRKAIEKCIPGNTLEDVHQAAVRSLTRGLVELGVLTGNVQSLVTDGAYKPYYMHRTGHWLGLDVHDIAPVYYQEYLLDPYKRPLEAGNLCTVEPGLYFSANDETVPSEYRGIGIRLEDDILITKSSYEILTEQVPIERADVEALMK